MLQDRSATIERITSLFAENFSERGELGAAVSIWQDGQPLLERHGGYCDAHRTIPWKHDTLVLFWSATKGLGAACLLHALQEAQLTTDRRVTDLWPEFGQAGKSEITIAQLMSHQGGVSALDEAVDITDYPGVVAALEKQTPLWPPGAGHGYHARTFGFLLDELVRRITNLSIGTYWRKVFADPLDLDIWIGLPHEENTRVATIYAAKVGKPPEPAEFYKNLMIPGTLQRRTFTSPRGLHAVSAMNSPRVRAEGIVSLGGIGSATALAKFYAMLANGGTIGSKTFFNQTTLSLMRQTLSSGTDLVFGIPTAFSAGFMQNASGSSRPIFGPSQAAFGHPGAGGSHAFADPENRLSFAYVMNQMEQSLLPTDKSLRMVDALFAYSRQL